MDDDDFRPDSSQQAVPNQEQPGAGLETDEDEEEHGDSAQGAAAAGPPKKKKPPREWKLVKKWDRRTVDDGTIQAELEQLAHEFMEASGLIRLPGACYYFYYFVHFC